MELRHDFLAHGVYIVCAEHEGKRGGLAVAWATQVSTQEILICVGSQSATRELILASRAFGLSLLAEDQVAVAECFGRRSGHKHDKLAEVSYHAGATGSPLLDDCAATFDCRVETVYEHGQSRLIVGRIVEMERIRAEYVPLIYKEEDYS